MIINQNVVKMTLDQQSAVIRSWVNIYTVHRPVGQLYKEQKCFWSTYRTLNLVGELLKMPFFLLSWFPFQLLGKIPWEKPPWGERVSLADSSRTQSVMAGKSQLVTWQAQWEAASTACMHASSTQFTFSFALQPGPSPWNDATRVQDGSSQLTSSLQPT